MVEFVESSVDAFATRSKFAVVGDLLKMSEESGGFFVVSAECAFLAEDQPVAVELGEHLVRVNVICPGFIPTEITGPEAQPLIDATVARSPIKILGTPEDLQGIVVYLASDMARYHTGDTITLDGGMMAQSY